MSVEDMKFCFESTNVSCIRTIWPTSVREFMYLFFGSMCFLTVCGNLFVIVTIIHFKQLHSPTNYLILSLAMGDLLVGVLSMPPSMVRTIDGCWYFGDVFCQIHTGIDAVLSASSILHLSCISIDRYYAVCHPLQYKSRITTQNALIMSITCWIVCIILGFHEIEGDHHKYVSCKLGCVLVLSSTITTLYLVIACYFPTITMVCVYLKIFLVAQRQAQRINNTMSRTSASRKEFKAVKSLAIIIGCFCACWAPGFIITSTISYAPQYIVHTGLWTSYLNSAFNPFIYAFFYSWFRRGFRMIISGKIFNSNTSVTPLSD